MLKIPFDLSRPFSLPEDNPTGDTGAGYGFQQRLTSVRRSRQEREHFHFLRTLCRDHAGEYRQWKALFQQRTLLPQTWRLHGGQWEGTCIDIRQDAMQRTICISCPSERVAMRFRQVKPLIESACNGPWLTLTLIIRTHCD